jgi:lysophospholipase L1-like esterase
MRFIGLAFVILLEIVGSSPAHALVEDFIVSWGRALVKIPAERESVQNALYTGNLHGRNVDVVAIGDSLTTGFFDGGPWRRTWEALRRRQGNWFLDTHPPPDGIHSVFQRLAEHYGVRAIVYARAGASIDRAGLPSSRTYRILGRVDDLSHQVDRALNAPSFPNLILIWIGHNNMNYVPYVGSQPNVDPDALIGRIPEIVSRGLEFEMARLADRAARQNYPVAIVVYDLLNWDSFVRARDCAEAVWQVRPEAHPNFASMKKSVPALNSPEGRAITSRIAHQTNTAYRDLVIRINARIGASSNVRFFSSDGLSHELGVDDLHTVDVWHPSQRGHRRLAEGGYRGIQEPLDFLGLGDF